jgi:hypothetical protein
MFTLRSAKSSIICKTNNGIIRKNEGSTRMTNSKCKISFKEVHILNFEEHTNPMFFIFFFSDRPCLYFYNITKNHTIQKMNERSNDCLNMHKMG